MRILVLLFGLLPFALLAQTNVRLSNSEALSVLKGIGTAQYNTGTASSVDQSICDLEVPSMPIRWRIISSTSRHITIEIPSRIPTETILALDLLDGGP